MEPTLTAIIPSVGRASLQSAILSARSQSGVKVDILVIDDSKTQDIQLDFQDVTLMRTGGNKGVSYARNLGVQNSSSKYVAFLDDDDIWSINKSVQQIRFMLKENVRISLTSAKVRRGEFTFLRPSLLLNSNLSPLENLYRWHRPFSNKHYLPLSTVLAERDIFLSSIFDEELLERENIAVLEKIYDQGNRILQFDIIGATINYSSAGSLRRMNIKNEIDWLHRMSDLSQKFRNNFCLESSRNFMRTHDHNSATKMIRHIEKPNFPQCFYALLYLVINMFLSIFFRRNSKKI